MCNPRRRRQFFWGIGTRGFLADAAESRSATFHASDVATHRTKPNQTTVTYDHSLARSVPNRQIDLLPGRHL